jgi:glucose/mannose-6-phosphate isomerase
LKDPFPADLSLKFDPHRVHATYERWPALAREGFRAKVELPGKRFARGFVLGMGGSAAGGDILASWLSDRPGIEMAVFKGQIPLGDMSGSLTVACSASGQTEETIAMMKTAVKRGAEVVCISGGGSLMELAGQLGVPHIRMPEVVAPRYMLPFIVFSCLAVFNGGLGLQCEDEAGEAFAEMDAEGKDVGLGSAPPANRAKALASGLLDRTAAVYGSRITRGVGIRFKNVLNENSKVHALFDGVPDAFHNDIESWEGGGDSFVPVFLRHSMEGERDRAREDRMVDILSAAGQGPIQVSGRGESSLAQLMSMAYRLDMVSYYVAMGLGRDPFPTLLIDKLKSA